MKDFTDTINKIEQGDNDRLMETKEVCDVTLDQISTWQLDFRQKLQNKNTRGLYILVKRTESSLNIMKDNSQRLQEKSLNTNNEFVPHTAAPSENTKEIGVLAISPCLRKKIKIRSKDENKAVICTSLRFICESKLLVVDFNNAVVKILKISSSHSTSDSLLKSAKTMSAPFQAAVTPNGNIFVTTPWKNVILKFSDCELSFKEEIQVEGECRAIGYIHEKVRTYLDNPRRVLDLDYHTNEVLSKKAITGGFKGKIKGKMQTLTTWYSTAYPEDGSIIFTCHENNCVYKLEVDGKVTMIAESDILIEPRGLCMVDQRTLVVCSTEGKALYMVRLDGRISKLVDNLSFKPKAVAFCRETSELAVGGHSDFIHVYSFKF